MSNVDRVDPYATLQIESDATPDQIREAFRRKVRLHHPDTSPTTAGDAGLRRLIEAYHLLMDPASRALYDAAHRNPARSTTSAVDTTQADPSARRRRACRTCHGAGEVGVSMTCSACGGLAEATSLEGGRARILRCASCRGRGSVIRSTQCPTCGGRGQR